MQRLFLQFLIGWGWFPEISRGSHNSYLTPPFFVETSVGYVTSTKADQSVTTLAVWDGAGREWTPPPKSAPIIRWRLFVPRSQCHLSRDMEIINFLVVVLLSYYLCSPWISMCMYPTQTLFWSYSGLLIWSHRKPRHSISISLTVYSSFSGLTNYKTDYRSLCQVLWLKAELSVFQARTVMIHHVSLCVPQKYYTSFVVRESRYSQPCVDGVSWLWEYKVSPLMLYCKMIGMHECLCVNL